MSSDMAPKGIPEGASRLIPRLFCKDPVSAIAFYSETFGAIERVSRPGPDGKVVHAMLTIGSQMMMIEAEWPEVKSRAPSPDGSSPVVLFLYVPDVDATVERALQSGAQLLVPIKDQFWGDRTAWIMDPAGHVWTIASRMEETTEEERKARWSEMVNVQSKQ